MTLELCFFIAYSDQENHTVDNSHNNAFLIEHRLVEFLVTIYNQFITFPKRLGADFN